MAPQSFNTLVELLEHRAQVTPDQIGHGYRGHNEQDWQTLRYGQLSLRAKAIGAVLAEHSRPGARALLIYPPGLAFHEAFFGCVYAGLIAVPVAPVRRQRDLPLILGIAMAAGVELIIGLAEHIEQMKAFAPHLTWIATDTIEDSAASGWVDPKLSPRSLAFLQFTSGSTGAPKGVMVGHDNVLHNGRVIDAGFQDSRQTITVTWLPHFHDMGLIGCIIQPMIMDCPVYSISPLAFMQRPVRWLQAISELGATTSGGPNFGYELCTRKVTDEQLEGLDLSSWAVAFIGAEPIRLGTLDRFTERLAPVGFRRDAFHPCYGLAEATLCTTNSSRMAPLVVRKVSAAALLEGRAASPGDADDAVSQVGVGRPMLQTVRLVDPVSLEVVAPGHVGEVWVAGGSVTHGYWKRPEETEETFGAHTADGEGPFLRTGDLGYMVEDELFITGRMKDLIIIRGKNHHPHDIEATVAESDHRLESSGGCAFTIDEGGEDRLVVVQEVKRAFTDAVDAQIETNARRAVAMQHGLQLHRFVLIKRPGLPRTTSGKVRRRACREALLGDTLPVLPIPPKTA